MPNFGLCVCVFGVKSADMSVGECAPGMWRPEQDMGCLPLSPSALSLEAGSLTGSSLFQLGWQATQDLSSSASQCQGYRHIEP